MARLNLATADRGRVETEQRGQVLAVTELGWWDARTVWRTVSGGDHSALHQRAVGLFTPGGALLASPAALRFVTRVLAEARR